MLEHRSSFSECWNAKAREKIYNSQAKKEICKKSKSVGARKVAAVKV